MAGTEPKVDRELLGRVAALTPGQQRWLRTILQSVFSMEALSARARVEEEEAEERPRRAKPKAETPAAPAEEAKPRKRGLEELLRGEGSAEEEYPELADDLKGIGDVADLLREAGRERRKFGEELLRLFEGSEEEPAGGEDEGDEGDDGARSS